MTFHTTVTTTNKNELIKKSSTCVFVLSLQAYNKDSSVIFELSGAPSTDNLIYQSNDNVVTLVFTTDSTTNLEGWRVEFKQIDPVVTTTVQITTPARK